MNYPCHQIPARSRSALRLLLNEKRNRLLLVATTLSGWALAAPSAVLAQVTVSPASLTWAKVAVGNAGGPKVATLTNAGAASVTLSSIAFAGSGAANFIIFQKTCGATLAQAASCTVTVLFEPKTAGTFSAALAFTDSATGSPQEVAVSGIGTDVASTGTATTSPSALSWNTVAIGSAGGPKVATLTNSGSSALTLSSIGFTGADPGDFSIYQKTCGTTLAVSASCTATVLFKPTASGTRSASLTFGDSAANSPQQVALSGIGLSATGTVSVAPTALSFGSITDGSTSAPKTITVSNTTTGSVTLKAGAISGSGAGQFAVTSTTCGSALAASASCTANIVFKPAAATSYSAAWTITSSQSATPLSVSLSGTGAAAQGSATVSPASLSWSAVSIGNEGGPKLVTLTNTGASSVTINAIGLAGSNPGDFIISQNTCGAALATTASCAVSVRFKPTVAGTRTATLTFADSATGGPQQVSLIGLGTTSTPQGSATVTPSSLNWIIVSIGNEGGPKVVTLTNTGTTSLTLSSIGFTGADPGDFIISQNTCGATLAAAASCAVSVRFKPTVAGNLSASLAFTDNASGSPQQVPLTGLGNAGSFVSPPTITLSEGATQQYFASLPSTWRVSCGSITQTGLYTAPLTPGTCTVFGDPLNGQTESAGTVTVSSPITIAPGAVNLHALNTQQFTSSQPVQWTSSCGSISASGLFTAPAVPGPCTITATASSGTANTATVVANVDLVNYTAWKGGGGVTGAQTDELLLTPANVNSTSFGLLWQANVDGFVNAQPLYMNALMINGAIHNVVFVATANDSVYALDGDTGAQLWQISLLPSGATPVSSSIVQFADQPQIGVLSTPVIDPSTNTLYVVSETSEQNATNFPHRLHALDVTTGKEKFGGPVLISNPQLAPVHKLQRPGLTLANGSVYVAIGSLNDAKPYNGMLLSFNAATLAEQSVWVATPSGDEGGIWMGGAAPAVDGNGNIYVATGNGTFDALSNFGESAVKLTPNLQLLDYFAPWNHEALSDKDTDLGSGDVMIAPDQNGPFPHELIVCGKPTPVYVLDRDNMGHAGTTSNNIIQTLDNEVGALGPGASSVFACYTAPAMWQQNVYFGGKYDVLKMFSLNPSTGMLSPTPVAQDSLPFGYPGADPVVSANGATNGIVWTIDPGTGTLRASDADNIANLLYSGSIPGGAIRWTIPTVVNGHVYVGEQGLVFGFGLK